MKIDILNEAGKKTGKKIELDEKIFAIEPHDHAIWLDVRSIRANQRQGTHSTKGRSYVSGGGRKPFRQKGTGRARQGSIRAPHHVGGGRVFGPHPHTYNVGINSKVKVLARKSALSYKAKENGILVVEDFTYEKPKTSTFANFLNNLEISDKKVLLLTAKNEKNIYLSASNIPKVAIRESVTFSTYDVLNAEKLVVQEGALQKINEVLGK
jgi:large subunit ribosomal protein L4